MRGKQILTLLQIKDAACEKRSLICPLWSGFKRPRPAAFVINLPGDIILKMMMTVLYLYEKRRSDAEKQSQ